MSHVCKYRFLLWSSVSITASFELSEGSCKVESAARSLLLSSACCCKRRYISRMSSENVEHHLVKENVFDFDGLVNLHLNWPWKHELDTNSMYIITRMRACNGLMQKLHTHSILCCGHHHLSNCDDANIVQASKPTCHAQRAVVGFQTHGQHHLGESESCRSAAEKPSGSIWSASCTCWNYPSCKAFVKTQMIQDVPPSSVEPTVAVHPCKGKRLKMLINCASFLCFVKILPGSSEPSKQPLVVLNIPTKIINDLILPIGNRLVPTSSWGSHQALLKRFTLVLSLSWLWVWINLNLIAHPHKHLIGHLHRLVVHLQLLQQEHGHTWKIHLQKLPLHMCVREWSVRQHFQDGKTQPPNHDANQRLAQSSSTSQPLPAPSMHQTTQCHAKLNRSNCKLLMAGLNLGNWHLAISSGFAPTWCNLCWMLDTPSMQKELLRTWLWFWEHRHRGCEAVPKPRSRLSLAFGEAPSTANCSECLKDLQTIQLARLLTTGNACNILLKSHWAWTVLLHVNVGQVCAIWRIWTTQPLPERNAKPVQPDWSSDDVALPNFLRHWAVFGRFTKPCATTLIGFSERLRCLTCSCCSLLDRSTQNSWIHGSLQKSRLNQMQMLLLGAHGDKQCKMKCQTARKPCESTGHQMQEIHLLSKVKMLQRSTNPEI